MVHARYTKKSFKRELKGIETPLKRLVAKDKSENKKMRSSARATAREFSRMKITAD